jgi:hypothetical protein
MRQRTNYRLQQKESRKNDSCPYQALESMGFRWNDHGTWGDRLSDLVDYRKTMGTAMSRRDNENIEKAG